MLCVPLDRLEWIFGTYKLNVLTWLELQLLCMIFNLCSYSDFFFLFDKWRSSKFREGSRVQQTPEEGRTTYRLKRCGNSNKDEDNCPKTFIDKIHQALSQKFRQMIIWDVSTHAIKIDIT